MATPTLMVLGGANGSGKTTLAREFVALENLIYLGADDIARELNPAHPEQAAIEAARVFSQRFNELIAKDESLLVESTLSGLSLRKWIKQAQSRGYAIQILFVYLDSPELCIQRVAARVAKGGHHVPADDIKRRFFRANSNFWHTYRNLAGTWGLFYNAGDEIIQVVSGNSNGITILEEARFRQWQTMVES